METTKANLPNATAVLVLGILSIVLGCAGIGLFLGIIGLILARNDRAMYRSAPNEWLGWGNLNAGWILCIVGTCLGFLGTAYWVFILTIARHLSRSTSHM